jgi:hypothetical protein
MGIVFTENEEAILDGAPLGNKPLGNKSVDDVSKESGKITIYVSSPFSMSMHITSDTIPFLTFSKVMSIVMIQSLFQIMIRMRLTALEARVPLVLKLAALTMLLRHIIKTYVTYFKVPYPVLKTKMVTLLCRILCTIISLSFLLGRQDISWMYTRWREKP